MVSSFQVDKVGGQKRKRKRRRELKEEYRTRRGGHFFGVVKVAGIASTQINGSGSSTRGDEEDE